MLVKIAQSPFVQTTVRIMEDVTILEFANVLTRTLETIALLWLVPRIVLETENARTKEFACAIRHSLESIVRMHSALSIVRCAGVVTILLEHATAILDSKGRIAVSGRVR